MSLGQLLRLLVLLHRYGGLGGSGGKVGRGPDHIVMDPVHRF